MELVAPEVGQSAAATQYRWQREGPLLADVTTGVVYDVLGQPGLARQVR